MDGNTLTVDRIFGASLSPLPSTNENINYDSLAKGPTLMVLLHIGGQEENEI